MIPTGVLLQLAIAALAAAGVPAPLLAAATAATPAASKLLEDLIERHQAGEPLPELLQVEPPRDTEIVERELGVSPAAATLPPPEGQITAEQASLDDEPGWGRAEAPTKVEP